jgi:hypothetical protein
MTVLPDSAGRDQANSADWAVVLGLFNPERSRWRLLRIDTRSWPQSDTTCPRSRSPCGGLRLRGTRSRSRSGSEQPRAYFRTSFEVCVTLRYRLTRGGRQVLFAMTTLTARSCATRRTAGAIPWACCQAEDSTERWWSEWCAQCFGPRALARPPSTTPAMPRATATIAPPSPFPVPSPPSAVTANTVPSTTANRPSAMARVAPRKRTGAPCPGLMRPRPVARAIESPPRIALIRPIRATTVGPTRPELMARMAGSSEVVRLARIL